MKLEYAHSLPPGKSIIEKIQEALDHELDCGDSDRAAGMANALGILRGSGEEHELELAMARTGLEWEDEEAS